MSTDTLLAWASKPASRRMMSMVGLPTPQPLRRGEGPWVAEPLSGQTVVLHGAESLREVIAGLGAEVVTDTKRWQRRRKRRWSGGGVGIGVGGGASGGC